MVSKIFYLRVLGKAIWSKCLDIPSQRLLRFGQNCDKYDEKLQERKKIDITFKARFLFRVRNVGSMI